MSFEAFQDERIIASRGFFDVENQTVGEKPSWGWDFAFVFAIKKPDEDVKPTRVEIIARLRRAGFVFSQILSEKEEIVILRFTLPPDVMKDKAEQSSLDVELKSEYGGGHMDYLQKYSRCFVNDDREKKIGAYFSPSDRIIIIRNTLESKESWGCAFNIEELVLKGCITQAFAIHSKKYQKLLGRTAVWERWYDPFWVPPFRDMKDYLGPRVGFYFAFASELARNLSPLALFSIIIFVLKRFFYDRRNFRAVNIVLWVFAIATILWACVFLELLKRKIAELVVDWGMTNYDQDTADEVRPQYKGHLRYGFYSSGGFVPLDDLAKKKEEEKDQARFNPASNLSIFRQNLGRRIYGDGGGSTLKKSRSDNEIPINAYANLAEHNRWRIVSIILTVFLICFVVVLTFLLLWYRNEIICAAQGFNSNECKCHFDVACTVAVEGSLKKNIKIVANALPGILNGLIINVFNLFWPKLSMNLTNRENHRTTQRHEDSFVYKYFAFQFFSNYISLFYIAFISSWRTDKNICRLRFSNTTNTFEPDCMKELETQMISLLLTKTIVQQVIEVGVPLLTNYFTQWRTKRHAGKEGELVEGKDSVIVSRYVHESKMPSYGSTVKDYSEMVIQFGYLVLFGVAFPLTVVVMFIDNMIEVRTDAFKILKIYQRVNADKAANIGAWFYILKIITFIAMFTNAGLLVFTANTANTIFAPGRFKIQDSKVLLFLILVNLFYLCWKIIGYFVSDIPSKTRKKLARQKYEIARHFDIGWENAFRGADPFKIEEDEIEQCKPLGDKFDEVSDDEEVEDDLVENEQETLQNI